MAGVYTQIVVVIAWAFAKVWKLMSPTMSHNVKPPKLGTVACPSCGNQSCARCRKMLSGMRWSA
jgi:hypothetical protein